MIPPSTKKPPFFFFVLHFIDVIRLAVTGSTTRVAATGVTAARSATTIIHRLRWCPRARWAAARAARVVLLLPRLHMTHKNRLEAITQAHNIRVLILEKSESIRNHLDVPNFNGGTKSRLE